MPRSYLLGVWKISLLSVVQTVAGLSRSIAVAVDRWRSGLEKTTGWHRVHPPDGSCDFLDVCLVNQNVGFAVGRKGIIFKTTDGGITWNQLNHNQTTEDLYGVHFVDQLVGYAVGNSGTILRTSDGGGSWAVQTNYLGGNTIYQGVFVLDAQKAIIVGGTLSPRFGADNSYTYLPGRIFLTTDGGIHWSAPTGVPVEMPWLNAIVMGSSAKGTAVGGKGHYSPLGQFYSSSIIMRTTDGGQTWSSQANPYENQVYAVLDFPVRDVGFHGEDSGIAISHATPPVYTSDGQTWSDSKRDRCFVTFQNAVCFLDANTAVHVGHGSGAAGILKSTDAGQNWRTVDYGTYVSLEGVSFGSPNKGVAVGEHSTVVRSDDGGETWQPSSQFQSWVVSDHEKLMALFFADSSAGYAVGWFGTILRTTNGGATWERLRNAESGLNAVYFRDAQNGFVGGGHLFRTVDGCVTLEQFRTKDSGQTYSILNPAEAQSGCSLSIDAIDFGDALTGVVVGTDGIYRTTDGGATWHKVSPQCNVDDLYLHGVQFVDSGTVVAAGTRSGWGGTVLRSTDAGAAWQRLDLPNPASPTPGQLCARSLNGIHFPKGQSQVGYAVGDTGTVIKTYDGGNSWQTIELRIGTTRIFGHWKGLFFVDLQNGWLVGDRPESGSSHGAILHTSDGGESWEKQETSPATPETFDGRRLQDVWFVTDRIGTVVGHGGLIVHTGSGGA